MSRLVSAFQDKVVDRYNIRKPKKAAKKFRQFVEKLVARAGEQCPAPNRCGKMNKHWRPYISRWRHTAVSRGGYCPSIRRCGYCDVPYRVIARAETVQEDQQFIGHMANVEFQKIGREQFSMSYSNVF